MDQINLNGLAVYAYHGVLEEEKAKGQTFYLDFVLQFDTSCCHDAVEETVHYGEFAQCATDFCQGHRFDLIETLANALCAHLLSSYPKLEALTVTVHKPEAPIPLPFGDVSITLTRRWTPCCLGIGSNLGDKEAYLSLAKEAVQENPQMRQLVCSSHYETEPYGVTDQIGRAHV